MRDSYRFARTPHWLAGHALAGTLLIVFVIAGFWQLDRHNEQRDRNALATERQSARALDADRFFEAVADTETVALLEYRTVRLDVLSIDWPEAIRIRNRSLDGLAGCHLAVPVEASGNLNGSPERPGVLVVAGWLPQSTCEIAEPPDWAHNAAALDAADVLEGRIRLSQERGLLGPRDPPQGRLASLARTDVERIDQQTTLDLVAIYVELTSAAGGDGTHIALGDNAPDAGGAVLVTPLPPPALDAGPHLGYTLQWFSFAIVAIVGYTLVLRHQARKGESEEIADD